MNNVYIHIDGTAYAFQPQRLLIVDAIAGDGSLADAIVDYAAELALCTEFMLYVHIMASNGRLTVEIINEHGVHALRAHHGI